MPGSTALRRFPPTAVVLRCVHGKQDDGDYQDDDQKAIYGEIDAHKKSVDHPNDGEPDRRDNIIHLTIAVSFNQTLKSDPERLKLRGPDIGVPDVRPLTEMFQMPGSSI